MTNELLCSECGDGLIILDFIQYLRPCGNCGKMRMCQEMGELN